MAYYIKCTTRVSDVLGMTAERNRTADGNVLLWQADLNSIEGNTLLDRANKVGGALLTPEQAKAETDGIENPIEVATPEEYLPKEEEAIV